MSVKMSLERRIQASLEFLNRELARYTAPVINCSFGKDSLALLHLLLTNGFYLPIISYMNPAYPRKYRFARAMIEGLPIAVTDYPPYRISMMYGKKNSIALTEEFMTSPVTTTAIPIDIIQYREGDDLSLYRCGLDLLARPTGTFEYPWDACLIGHKDCDSDTIYGDVPLVNAVLYQDAGPDCLFPLREWSHDDVWEYLEHFEISVQEDRYDQKNRTEWDDKTFNPDWFEACTNCVDKRLVGTKVYCPKVNREIDNISAKVPEFTTVFDYFGRN